MPYQDRKSTRLNSSHGSISYAVFCLKKKTKNRSRRRIRLTHSQDHPCNITTPLSPPSVRYVATPAPRATTTDSPFFFFFFNDTATTEIYTLSLHDALPI